MISPALLKEKLIKIKEDNYLIDDSTDVFEISLDMMRHIGSNDSELRDRLIYSTFLKWSTNNVFTAEQMRQLLKISLDEMHLFYKIGESNTDSVFTRSFSVLIIPLALYMDKNDKFLSEEEIIYIKDKVINYMNLEADYRGYVEHKGWAHAAAHAVDALDDIAKSDYIDHNELLEILDAIKIKICINNYTYIAGEDERMVTATMSVFNRNLLQVEKLTSWINSFADFEKTGKYPEELNLITNIKAFLRSLYFKMLYQENSNIFTNAILDTLQRL